MNSFFKSFWAALLAFVVGSILTTFLSILIFAGFVASIGSTKTVAVKPNSVLKIDLGSTIVDAPSNKSGSLNLSLMSFTPSNTLLEVLRAVEVAETDNNIKGIYINLTGMGSMNMANVEELRAALVKFKENSGKFIVAYNENYMQVSYYLSTVADKVIMNPEGVMDWRGLSATVMFYKGLLDKLDVEVDIFRHGTFKSAVEPYMTDKMSPANRHQMETYAKSLWNVLLDDISASRGISKEKLDEYASTLVIRSAAQAKAYGMVDEVLYEDQVNSILAAMVAGEEIADYSDPGSGKAPESISLDKYITYTSMATRRISKNKIAVVYADGGIQSGENANDVAGSASVAAQLAKAREDKNVKAVVFRVNSPGGSVLASEVMWREVNLLREEKPVIVSMGNRAASGGYYISCPADVILADRTTLTGSIGVFGMAMNLEKAMKNKLGITVDVAKTNPHADMLTGFRGVNRDEREYMMGMIEEVYANFVGHVADGRNMTREAVDEIGQGRIWLGTDALSIGLIDGFGGLNDAIALAADRAGVADDFRVYEVVDEKDQFQLLMEAAFSGAREARLRSDLGEAFVYYNHLKQTLEEPGIQARLPYEIEIR